MGFLWHFVKSFKNKYLDKNDHKSWEIENVVDSFLECIVSGDFK